MSGAPKFRSDLAQRVVVLEEAFKRVHTMLTHKSLCGFLRSAINDHGPITPSNMSSAAKRIHNNIMATVPHIESTRFLKAEIGARVNRLAVCEIYLQCVEKGERLEAEGRLEEAADARLNAAWARQKYHELEADELYVGEQLLRLRAELFEEETLCATS